MSPRSRSPTLGSIDSTVAPCSSTRRRGSPAVACSCSRGPFSIISRFSSCSTPYCRHYCMIGAIVSTANQTDERSLRPTHQRRELRADAAHRLVERLRDAEDARDAGHAQGTIDRRVGRDDERDLLAAGLELLAQLVDHLDTGAVEIVDVGEIEDEAERLVGDLTAQCL